MDETERLNDLIARCEKPSGSSRELDALIWCALHRARFHHVTSSGWLAYDNEHGRAASVGMGDVLKVTESFDAAMTLVPKHYTPIVCVPPHTTCEARLWRHASGECSTVRDSQDQDVEAEGRTGPLALVIAALRARLPHP